jgi:RHS repeat-associated protein
LEQVIGTNVYYFHHDQLGSTRVLTDTSGATAATFSHDAYGNLTASTGNVTTPLLFGGQYRDAESGLYYMRARYYDPSTAQFLTRDPLVATTRSPYGYVGDNPVNGTDPSGMIDQSYLSQSQIGQINKTCSTWQNQSLCTQAAFCAEWTAGLGSQSGGSCHAIAEIAANDYRVVEQGLHNAGPCGDVHLLNGYVATHQEAVRDLAETRAAFQVAVQSINFYNDTNTCKARAASLTVAVGGTGGVVFDAIGWGGVIYYGWSQAMQVPQRAVTGGPGLPTLIVGTALAATQC